MQIDARCVKCGRLSGADVTLYEMRNHLFICADCQREAEQQGKQIAWASTDTAPAPLSSASQAQTQSAQTIAGPRRTISLSQPPPLPPDSLFAVLSLPLDAPLSTIEAALEKSMKGWMRAPRSPEKTTMLDRLQEWQELIEDEERLAAYRESMKPQRKGNALSVGGRLVLTTQEFVAACEASQEGWADGERYLRMGQLKHWVLFQLGDVALATDIGNYQTWNKVSDFHAFNEALYRMDMQRPFRLYSETKWQPLSTLPSARDPQELAALCDQHWHLGERNLFEGAMVFWLAACHQLPDVRSYFIEHLARYDRKKDQRGVGLELLLEHAVPTLEKPQLRVTFDGEEDGYAIKNWDRELNHKLVNVKVENLTRGFVSFKLRLDASPQGDWVELKPDNPLFAHGLKKEAFPVQSLLSFWQLSRLARGKSYQRKLVLQTLAAKNELVIVQEFPVTIRTQSYYQGLRGKLWLWGLRGNLPGLFWNALIALLLSFTVFKILPLLVPAPWYSTWTTPSDFIFPLLQMSVVEAVAPLQSLDLLAVLIFSAVIAFAGLRCGYAKGHRDESPRSNARSYRRWTGWLFFFLIVGVIWRLQYPILSIYLQDNNNQTLLNCAPYLIGDGILWLLCFVIMQVIVLIRSQLEKYLRTRYAMLLDLPGRE
ncbi:hypothetical protein [Dictyobacter arantiisoli]|uniref:hypothetical protein n=1 Tax=Dictyobacter arantiisoli TaxID=2014874 RepID=UPI0011EC4058|nr:hypothetical protein [Dictyobacter arantiisoli]